MGPGLLKRLWGQPEDAVPNTTISRFRKEVTERGLAPGLFEELARQLEGRGLLVKKGTLMDATIVEAQAKRPTLREGPGGSKTDPDARFTRKRGKTHFGYKAHIGMDAGSGLIRKALLTPANVNDTEVPETKRCTRTRRTGRNRVASIKDRIMRRAQAPSRASALGAAAERVDIAVARAGGAGVRDAEAVVRLRPGAVRKNATELLFKCMAYNLRRADRLVLAAV